MTQPVRLHACIDAVIEHAPGLKSFVLVPERPAPHFAPGQFLHLALDPYDPSRHWPESRCFSLASPPEERQRLRITVSAVGAFTQRMMRLTRGDEVWIKLPYGDFVVNGAAGETVVLVAGGTGITPFMSLLASSATRPCAVRVLYGARRPDLLIFGEALAAAAKCWPDLRWTTFVEEGDAAGAKRGRLSAEAALREARAAGGRATFYLSGPPLMLESMRADLAAASIPADRIRIDAWA